MQLNYLPSSAPLAQPVLSRVLPYHPYLRLILGMGDGKFTFKVIYLGLQLPRLQRKVL